jgi:hypothetical protein
MTEQDQRDAAGLLETGIFAEEPETFRAAREFEVYGPDGAKAYEIRGIRTDGDWEWSGASKSAFTAMSRDRCAVIALPYIAISNEEAGGRIEPKVPMPNGARRCSAKHV